MKSEYHANPDTLGTQFLISLALSLSSLFSQFEMGERQSLELDGFSLKFHREGQGSKAQVFSLHGERKT